MTRHRLRSRRSLQASVHLLRLQARRKQLLRYRCSGPLRCLLAGSDDRRYQSEYAQREAIAQDAYDMERQAFKPQRTGAEFWCEQIA